MGQVYPSSVYEIVRVEPCYESVFTDAARVVTCILDLLIEAVLVEILAIVVNSLGVGVERIPEPVIVQVGPTTVDGSIEDLAFLDPGHLQEREVSN